MYDDLSMADFGLTSVIFRLPITVKTLSFQKSSKVCNMVYDASQNLWVKYEMNVKDLISKNLENNELKQTYFRIVRVKWKRFMD